MTRNLKFIYALMMVFLMMPSFLFAQSTSWDEYNRICSDYYFLDRQTNYEEISCRVDVPFINNMVTQLSSQLEAVKNNIEIDKDLEAFTLTFNKYTGLEFSNPRFIVSSTSMAGVPDPQKFTSGIEMVNRGVNNTVEGIKMQLIGIFDDYMSPQKETYQDLSINQKTPEATTFTYIDTETGNTKTEVFSSNLIEVVESGNQTSSKATQKYEKTQKGKLILSEAKGQMASPGFAVDMDISIDYQLVEDLTFPSRLKIDVNQTVQTLETKGQWIINLHNCVKK